MNICVIPARGGSKRIPRKNIKTFCGAPMIGWAIQAAAKSNCFDRIVVSTDSNEVADVAMKLGAEVPFRRSAELADDHTPTAPVIADAIKQLNIEDDIPVCCLYATAPFVTSCDLSAGLSILRSARASFVLSVTTFAYPVQRGLRRDESGFVSMTDPSQLLTRSQDLEDIWHDAGQFYWGKARSWNQSRGIFDLGTYGHPIPRDRVQDIDTEEDWNRAEKMMMILQAQRRINFS